MPLPWLRISISSLALAAASSACSRGAARARHVLSGPDFRLELAEDTEATGKWSGNKVWPGALALLGHLNDRYDLHGLRLLELGCGLPFLSSALASLGAQVCATDHPEVIAKVQDASAVLHLEPRQKISFEPLAWGGALPSCADGLDLVVGADLVYDAFPVDDLFDTTLQLLNATGAAGVFALQPRQFPMTAALREPQLIGKFLRRFAQQGWQVSVEQVGPQALGMSEGCVQRSEGLVIATIMSSSAEAPTKRLHAKQLHYQRLELEHEEPEEREKPEEL